MTRDSAKVAIDPFLTLNDHKKILFVLLSDSL